ncbi:MAG TPA: hypothetical protein GXX19_07955 [Syntrophomonadaceae bacterium]|nr:hypothetical protein [Syntrophomonadaceae bacterium]
MKVVLKIEEQVPDKDLEATESKKKPDAIRVALELPYDDLATIYEYILKRLGINTPLLEKKIET